MFHLSRSLQRRHISKYFSMRIPASDPLLDDVWGFMSKEKSDELVKTQRALASMIQKSYVGTIKHQLQSRGFDQDDFQQGCKTAYEKLAGIYRKAEPVFKSQYSDIVEEALAEDLDQQLMRYQQQSRKPQLTVEAVDARLLFLIRARKETFEGPLFVRLFNALVSFSVQEFQPKYELLAAVEYKVREKFELLPSEAESKPAEAPLDTSLKVDQSEDKPKIDNLNEKEDDGDSQKKEHAAGFRRHFLVFAGDLPAGDIPIGTEADVVEFKVRSMGRAFGM